MSLRFGEIYLYSLNPQKLFGFLSFLLDVEATSSTESSIEFNFQNMIFIILQSDKKRIDKTKYFSLYVDDLSDLEFIQQNIEFYHYKEADTKFVINIFDSKLEFTDPDGRLWQVSHVPSLRPELQKKDLTAQM
jgi:hypothetical protein